MENTTVQKQTPPVDAKELERAVLDSVRAEIKVYPRRSLWASSLNDPCLRKNEYALTRWQDMVLHDAGLQQVFNEGKLHEPAVIDRLQKAGFQVRQSQRPLDEKVKHNGKVYKYNISGRLDIEITHPTMNGLWVPTEIKTCDPYTFDSVNSVEDMKKHKRPYVRLYPSQLNLYLYLMSKEVGLFLMKNKLSGALKFIWCELDFDLAEQSLKNAEIINEIVERIETDPDNADTYLSPRIPFEEKICGKCPFNHICLPDASFGGVELELDEETEEKLRRREELKIQAKQYEELDEEIKAKFKTRGIGKYLVAASFNVEVKEVGEQQRNFTIPKHLEVRIKALKTAKE